MSSQNAIIGEAYGTELPETVVEQADLTDELKMARFSKSAEFKRLKDYLEQRIEFYQTSLPTGEVVSDPVKAGQNWVVANAIIMEFKSVLQAYENAKTVVEDAQR